MMTMRKNTIPLLYAYGACLRSSTVVAAFALPHGRVAHRGLPAFGTRPAFVAATRSYSLFGRNKDDDDDDAGGLATRLAKKVLPRRLFRSKKKEERQVETGLSALLRDAPFPVRMAAKLVAPLLSGLAREIGAQSRAAGDVLEEARTLLSTSREVAELLGGGAVRVGAPFSQSSSSTNVNGQRSSVLRASVPVSSGTGVDGVATVSARNGTIERLELRAGGRTIDVLSTTSGSNNVGGVVSGGTVSSRGSGGHIGRNSNLDGDIIDAEFVEKK